jgi:hypothetical protein
MSPDLRDRAELIAPHPKHRLPGAPERDHQTSKSAVLVMFHPFDWGQRR